ncbi:MAG TPA: hypothetical protein PKI90_05100 [bacterium]|nr:hypothetical protein [bacterium]
MRKRARSTAALLAALLIGSVAPAGAASRSSRFTTNSLIARPASMGWANSALASDLSDGLYNPATLSTWSDGFHIYLNPVGLAAGLNHWNSLFTGGVASPLDELVRCGLVIRGISWQSPVVSIALQLSETLAGNPALQEGGRFFPVDGLLDHTFSQAAVRLRLAEPFAIGVAGYLVNREGALQRGKGYGGSYGMLIRPAPYFHIGVMYIDVPDDMADSFQALNRTIDESMNVGMAFSPQNCLLLSLDVRNVSEEDKPAKREIHLGGEWQAVPWLLLRAGCFEQQPARRAVFCGGVGLGTPVRSDSRPEDDTAGFPLALDLQYGVQCDTSGEEWHYSHFLTCSVSL